MYKYEKKLARVVVGQGGQELLGKDCRCKDRAIECTAHQIVRVLTGSGLVGIPCASGLLPRTAFVQGHPFL